ncbi:ZinT family metal-binding protein [Neotabrizicola sp. sgz301269]|uniref:ZinT family metal-binding protein n=1 Tax=Neotabrizicola sp. sgz301269 TaxID=3276282 RepID=UPI00376F6B78
MRTPTSLSLMILAVTFALGPVAQAETAKAGHDHHHMSEAEKQVYAGYFEDSQIQPRSLADWAGDWQSVYTLLKDGTLDPVMQAKAQKGDKSAEDYKAYYEIGYKTEVDRIVIQGDSVSFHSGDAVVTGTYAQDGHEVLTYEKGNRGVRYVFKKTAGDAAAPPVIQFSDHAIAPQAAGHYHLYCGDDRAQLLTELTNWPTYYPSALSGGDIVHEMLAH